MRPLHLASALAAIGFFLGGSVVGRGATPGKLRADSSVRTWTDSTGRFHAQGTLVSSDQSSIRLQKTTGSVITIALARLSDRDQQFVLNSRKASAEPAAAGSTGSASSASPTAWWDGLQANWESLTKPAIDDAVAVANAGPLILQSTQPMPENIIYLRLSRQFLERMAWRDVAQQAAVHDTVLGAAVTGVSHTVGSAEFELVPSDQFGSAEIHLFGTTTYNSVADAGPVQLSISGVTRFASAKALRFNGQGIHLGAAATNARTSSVITGIDTSLPGLRGRLALRIGGRRAEESRPDAEAITAQHTARQINHDFDKSASDEVAELWKNIGDQIAALPADHPLRQCTWQASSTKDALQIVFLAPAVDKNNFVPAPTPSIADADIEAQVHVAMVRSAIADVELHKLLQPMTIQLASSLGSMPSGRPVMRWSADHNWLSLSWQSGDHPAEPTQSPPATLASEGR
jgi:hypothetical protein